MKQKTVTLDPGFYSTKYLVELINKIDSNNLKIIINKSNNMVNIDYAKKCNLAIKDESDVKKILNLSKGSADHIRNYKILTFNLEQLENTQAYTNDTNTKRLYTTEIISNNIDLNYCDVLKFEPMNLRYINLKKDVIDRFKVTLTDLNGEEINNNNKLISVTLHVM